MALLYSSKETLMTRDQLGQLAVPAPRGRYHRPVSFGAFADLVAHRLTGLGWQIEQEEYAVTKDDGRMFGLMQLSLPRFDHTDWALQLGLRGSHDQSVPRALTLGSQVLVCSNLCFHGDLGVFSTRQTLNVWDRLPGMISSALTALPDMVERQEKRVDGYRLKDLRPRHGDAALVELHRRGALTASQLGRAISEWDHPTYEEHTEDGHTVWRLFNAATQALKPEGARVNHDLIRERSQKVSSFLDEVAGI